MIKDINEIKKGSKLIYNGFRGYRVADAKNGHIFVSFFEGDRELTATREYISLYEWNRLAKHGLISVVTE